MGFFLQHLCWRATVEEFFSAGLLTGWSGEKIRLHMKTRMGRYHWSLCRLHHTNPPQLKATGPSLIASDIQHNLPNSACACHGISQNCLTFDEVLDQILIQCSLNFRIRWQWRTQDAIPLLWPSCWFVSNPFTNDIWFTFWCVKNFTVWCKSVDFRCWACGSMVHCLQVTWQGKAFSTNIIGQPRWSGAQLFGNTLWHLQHCLWWGHGINCASGLLHHTNQILLISSYYQFFMFIHKW